MKTFLVVALSATAATAVAESTRFHSFEGFQSFIDGEAKGVAVTSDGTLSLAPPANRYFDSQEGRIAAHGYDADRVAAVFAESGRVIVIKDGSKAEEYGETPKGVPTAVAVDGKVVFVATLAPTAIYRFNGPGKPEKLELPKVDGKDIGQVWALRPTSSGLLMGSGLPGRVWRYGDKKFTEVFKPNETVVRSLATDKHGNIYVGGGSKGILYRGSAKGGFVAMHDSGLDEILEIQIDDDGTVYFVGLGGAKADGKGDRVAEKGKIRAQLIRVDAEGFSDALAGSDDEIIYSVALAGPGRVLVGSTSVDKENPRGRVYATVAETREVSLIHQSASVQIVGVIARGKGRYIAVTNEPAGLELLEAGFRREGEIALGVFDAATPSRFGSVQLEGQQPPGTSITVRLRSGQTAAPDDTWTAWTKDLPIGLGAPDLTPGRYVQAKLVLKSDGSKSPNARRVRIAYARQNVSPYMGEVALLAKGITITALPGDSMRERTVMINEKGLQELKRVDTSLNAGGEGGAKGKQSIIPGSLTVAWVAQDPNGDELKFDLYFRAEADTDWRLLKADLVNPFYGFEPFGLADGRYQFRVIAKDDDVNPPGLGRHEQRDSVWFTVDNSPPALSKLDVGKRKLTFGATDALSPIVKAEYSVDGQPMRPLVSSDGILDGQKEQFEVPLPESKGNQHSVSVRVEDEGGNAASGQTRF